MAVELASHGNIGLFFKKTCENLLKGRLIHEGQLTPHRKSTAISEISLKKTLEARWGLRYDG